MPVEVRLQRLALGFFGVTGPWDLAYSLACGANDYVEGVVVDLQVVGLLDPLPQRFIGGQTSWLPVGLRKRGQHVWRE